MSLDAATPLPSRAVDDRQRRAAFGARDPREPRVRAGRLLRVVARQGRARRRRAVRHAAAGVDGHRRRGRAARVCSPTAWSTTRSGPTSTSSCASSSRASTSSPPPRSSPATRSAPDRERVADACERGQTSIFGSGMNPGLANLLGIVSASVCDRIDSITILESVDSTGYDSPDTELPIGFAQPIDDPGLPAMTEAGTAVFGDAVRLVADALGSRARRGALRSGVRGDHRRPRPRLVADRRRLRRGRRGELAGHPRRVASWWRSTRGGARARTSIPTGRSSTATWSTSRANRACAPSSRCIPPPTSKRRRSRTTWCSG